MRIFTNIEAKSLPPLWNNKLPLAKQEPFPLENFPLIDDFEIVLEQLKGASWGFHIVYSSKKLGYIAGFPWWAHAELDLYRPSFHIPLNFNDFEQGWEIDIFDQDEYVYVLESDFDHPESGYLRWFRVEKERYLEEWKSAIDACCEIVRLGNAEYNELKNKR